MSHFPTLELVLWSSRQYVLSVCEIYSADWLTELRCYVPLNTQQVISEMFPKPISWLGIEKLNVTQQKHTFTN